MKYDMARNEVTAKVTRNMYKIVEELMMHIQKTKLHKGRRLMMQTFNIHTKSQCIA